MKDTSLIVLQHGLIVLQNGILWNNDHMKYIQTQLLEANLNHVEVLNVDINESKYTCDGIDICGELLADEIIRHVDQLAEQGKRVVNLSLVGYSLGGLIARYAIGILGQRGFFHSVQPDVFVTFATPHLGIRLPAISITARIFNAICGVIISRTGEQFQLQDHFDHQKRPLLLVLADPDREFVKYLYQFRTRRIYANIDNDLTVPYWTSAISVKNYFESMKKLDIELHTTYTSVITAFGLSDPKKSRAMSKWEWKKIGRFCHYGVVSILFPLILCIALLFLGTQGLHSRYRLHKKLSRQKTKNFAPSIHESSKHSTQTVSVDDTIVATAEFVAHPDLRAHSPPSQHIQSYHAEGMEGTCNVQPEKDLFRSADNLKLDPTTIKIHDWLDQLSWERVLVYIDDFNSHSSIVCRQKHFEGPGGRAVIQHFVDFISHIYGEPAKSSL